MQRAAIKESRQILRQIKDHLYQTHQNLGGTTESIDLVDVCYHPTNALASLNYITPRRNTAWVAGAAVQKGVQHLRAMKRTPRVQYIKGLYPPHFATTLLDMGLRQEQEFPLMIYVKNGFSDQKSPLVEVGNLPEGIRLECVTDQRGAKLWCYIWQTDFYEVISLGIEPLYAGQDINTLQQGQQLDILLYRNDFPAGIARLSIQEEVAHIVALAFMKETCTPQHSRILYAAGIKAALDHNCTLIYAPGQADSDMARSLGFLDFGSIVCYTSDNDAAEEDHDEHILGQPVLALR